MKNMNWLFKSVPFTLFFCFLASLLPAPSFSAPPNLITYQGRLKENNQPVTGNRRIEIFLCDSLSNPTLTSCTGSGEQTVYVSTGLFKAIFAAPVDLSAGSWYLELKVGGAGGQVLSPREQLSSVPFALFASTAAYVPGAVSKSGDTMTGALTTPALAVTANAYFSGVSSFSSAGNMYITGGEADQVLASQGPGASLKWSPLSVLGDGLGNHVATTTLNMGSWDMVGVSSVNFMSSVFITSATAAQGGGVYVSSNMYIVGYSSAANYYGDGSTLTGVSTSTFKIGDSYGGGKIFWVDATGKQVLIAANADQSTGIKWSNNTNATGATLDGVYAGKANTVMISTMQHAGSYAAQVCADYSVTVNDEYYDDWYLPSFAELKLLRSNKYVIGNPVNGYWSSTEYAASTIYALIVYFSGGIANWDKTNTSDVRCIRAGPSTSIGNFPTNAETVIDGAYRASTQTFTGSNTFKDITAASLTASSATIAGNSGVYGLTVSSNVSLAGTLYTATGNVGIGTATPSYRLVVSGGAGETGTIMAVSTGTTDMFWVTGDGAHALKYYGNGSNLTGVIGADNDRVLKAGDTMTGALSINNFALNMTGASGNIVSASSITTTGGFFGNGSTLSGVIQSSAVGTYPLSISGKVSQAGVDLSTVTTRLDTVATATATLRTDLNAVALSTGPLVNYGNWNTAFGWGNHALAGYTNGSALGIATGTLRTDLNALALSTGPLVSYANWNTAYGWGNHASAGYANGSAIATDTTTLANVKISSGLNSANIFVGNGSNQANGVAMSGDITISNTGATTIGGTKVLDSMISGMAASKLTGSISQALVNLSTVTANHVLKTGDTMTGVLDMAGFAINGVSTITMLNGSIAIVPPGTGGSNAAYGISIGSKAYNNYNSGVGVGYGAAGNSGYGVGVGYGAASNFGYGVGVGNVAYNNSSYGVGVGADAFGNSNYAVGIGAYSQNNQTYGSALGAYSYAASSSVALGSYAKANAEKSIAIGNGTVNNSTGTANFGVYAITTSSNISAAKYYGNGSALSGVTAVNIPESISVSTINAATTTPYGGINVTTNTFIQGNVGIGTTTPVAMLDVNGVAKISKYLTQDDTVSMDSTHILMPSDFGKTFVSIGPFTVTYALPPVMPGSDIGAQFTFVKLGAGKVTIQAANGSFIADSGLAGTLYNDSIMETYATITLRLVTDTKWVIIGGDGNWMTTN